MNRFNVTNPKYLTALEKIHNVKLTDDQYTSVVELINDECAKADERIKQQQVSFELLHREFTI